MINRFFHENNFDKSLNDEELEDIMSTFRKDGFLWLHNVFSKSVIDNLNNELKKFISRADNYSKSTWPTQKDNLRIQLTLEINDLINYSDIYGSVKILQILNEIFKINGVPNNKVKQSYKKIVIDSFTAISALPKCSEQHLHSDGSGLFDSPIDKILPTHAVILGVPLADLNQDNGTTEVLLGSHMKSNRNGSLNSIKPFLSKGDCYLMDYRLVHRGMANNSKENRIIIFVRYSFPWWRDVANFRRIVSSKNISLPINITKKGFLNIPENLKYLFRYSKQL